MTAADDVNLDDLKRRARRRLVGAIVLALAVAVVVPMILESDPKPLGEDVAVKIPPVDDGKFVNRLSDKGKGLADKSKGDMAKADAGKSASRIEPKADAPRSDAKNESPRTEPEGAGAADGAGKGEPVATAPKEGAAPASAKSDATKSDAAKAEPTKESGADAAKADPAKAESSNASPAAAGKAAPASANGSGGIPAAAPNGLFAVQVYAFSDAYGANSLVNKLKRVGYPAYSEPTTTSKGQLWRVRIGPFSSRDVAATARDKLKGEGYNGIVTTK